MPLREERLAFVGCGIMGEAMVQGLLAKELVEPGQVVASHPRPERCRELAKRHGIEAVTANREAVRVASVVALTVKPQVLDEVLKELAGSMPSDTLVLSIVAGASTTRIEAALGTPRVVRAMPNTPARIQHGMTVWYATPRVDRAARKRVRSILSALGEEQLVPHEDEVDMATALSGTGPAYVFLFMEALIEAGVHLGFSRRVAARLVRQTVLGAAEYAVEAPEHVARLRNEVTSPGGTTADALYHLEKGRLRTVISDAVWAAYRRCLELGGREIPRRLPGTLG